MTTARVGGMFLEGAGTSSRSITLYLPLEFLGCLILGLLRLTQNALSYLVEVVGDDAQAGVTCIAMITFVRTAVKPVVFETVDI